MEAGESQEHVEEGGEGCIGLSILYGKPPLLAVLPASIVAAAVATTSKEAAASTVVIGLIGYLALSMLDSPWRLPLLASSLAAHISALAMYYSNPLLLPLAIVERGPQGSVVNIDLVQIAMMAEASMALYRLPEARAKCSEAESGSPVEDHGEGLEGEGEKEDEIKEPEPGEPPPSPPEPEPSKLGGKADPEGPVDSGSQERGD